MKLEVKYGTKTFFTNIDSDEISENSDESSSGMLRTFGELRHYISEKLQCEKDSMKIIHKGKFILKIDDEPISSYNFCNAAKVLVLGIQKKDDSGSEILSNYQRKHLSVFKKLFEELGKELIEFEKNFLEGQVLKEALTKMDKRLCNFELSGLSHMEQIDALPVIMDNSSEEQKRRNREKRKTMIDFIEDLLNANEKYKFRLKQYRFSVEHKDEFQ